MKGDFNMKKIATMMLFTLLMVLILPQTALANTSKDMPPKPTYGVESSKANYGSSIYGDIPSLQSSKTLLIYWNCEIYNNGNTLYIKGRSQAKYLVDEIRITLYLQKWENSKWVDVTSRTFRKYDSAIIIQAFTHKFESGNYYRTRAVHYAKDGSKTDTRTSTSSYIYVN